MLAAMRQIVDESPNLTEQQTDKVFELREKAMDYTHADKDKEHTRYMATLSSRSTMFRWAIILVGIIVVIVAWRRPDYLQAVIIAVVSFLGGFGAREALLRDSK